MWGPGGHSSPLSTPSHLSICSATQTEGGIPPCFFPPDNTSFSFKHKQHLRIHLLKLSHPAAPGVTSCGAAGALLPLLHLPGDL